ncbi:unnamed protein product [Cuscuta epithymum]|uniref:Uncharacterized protein n=1 Tax=Cuscuta epithymum TaxID=186058 RepID=A0AAV0FYL4_9ASTE|nr:unnamed protein product [Cuscuta epithymum]
MRLDYARILVGVDASKPHTLFVDIKLPSRQNRRQFIIYETFPNYRFHYKKHGHDAFTCKPLHQLERKKKQLGKDHIVYYTTDSIGEILTLVDTELWENKADDIVKDDAVLEPSKYRRS